MDFYVSGARHTAVKNTKNKMIFMLILCNVVQKRCSHVVVQCEAGPVKSKVKVKSGENLWIIV